MTTTKSPLSSDGEYAGLFFPIRIFAARDAIRPTAVPCASTTYQLCRTSSLLTTIVFEDIHTPIDVRPYLLSDAVPGVAPNRTQYSLRQGTNKITGTLRGVKHLRMNAIPKRVKLPPTWLRSTSRVPRW